MKPSDCRNESFESDGLRLSYSDQGDRKSFTVVLLHTNNDSGCTWRKLASGLAEDYRVVCLDQRGHGSSDWSAKENYDRSRLVLDIVELIDHLGLNNVVLTGHGNGGLTAIELASRGLPEIGGLVVIDSDVSCTGNGIEADDRLRYIMSGNSVETVTEHLRTIQPNAAEDFRWEQAEDLSLSTQDGLKGCSDPAITQGNKVCNLMNVWSSVQCPTLVLRGRKSQVLTHEHAVRMKESVPQTRLAELEGAGHWVHREVPGAVESTLRWFLESFSRLPS